MGSVWLAEDIKLTRAVALKLMTSELSDRGDMRARFEREALAAAQLRSVHVVQIFDYGMENDVPYIVMEYLRGESLAQRLRRTGRMSIGQACAVIIQMCKGLRVAHEAGLIHRDLKPGNIFLALRDDVEVVKILDFGVVKAVDTFSTADATDSGALLGTPQYMSPEQARAHKDIDHRSDLWSAAVIAFLLLTDVNPFHGESVADVILKLCGDGLPQPTYYVQHLPRALDPFFAAAFARDRNLRYQSARELAIAFEAALNTEGAATVKVPSPLGSAPFSAPNIPLADRGTVRMARDHAQGRALPAHDDTPTTSDSEPTLARPSSSAPSNPYGYGHGAPYPPPTPSSPSASGMTPSAPFLPDFGVPLAAPPAHHHAVPPPTHPLAHLALANTAPLGGPIPIIPKGSANARRIVAGGVAVAFVVLVIALSVGDTEELLVAESFQFHVGAIAETLRQNADAMAVPSEHAPPIPSASASAK
jgi:serine/threonine-protein kinase